MIHRLRAAFDGLPPAARGAAGTIARRLPVSVRYGRAFVRERNLIARSERDAAFTRQVVEQRLGRVLSSAIGTEFWRGRLADVVRTDAAPNVALLREIAPIDKDALRIHSEEMIAPGRSSGLKYVTTGGTSGAQVGFWLDKDVSVKDWAYVVSAWERAGFRLDEPRVVLRGVRLGEGAERLLTRYEPLRRELYVSTFDMDAEHLPEIRRRVDAFGARFIHGYPSAMEALGRDYRASGAQPPPTEGLFAVSENLYPSQREALESLFNARVLSLYALSERVCFAAECERSSALHVAETYGIIELIDEKGDVVTEPGVRGEIVATGLLSDAVPLIRYRTGDYAMWADGPCECGRPGPRLAQIEGRWTQEYLVSNNGHRIFMTSINMHSRIFEKVVRYRFVQTTEGRADLLVEPGRGFTAEDGAAILSELDAKLGGQIDVRVIEVPSLPLSPRGKHLFIDQRVASRDAG